MSDLPLNENPVLARPQIVNPPRRFFFFRPWARRDAAIQNLQMGFGNLMEVMQAVRDNMEKQGRRQEELLSYLSHLPHALEMIPESNRVQAETLRAIHQQLTYQTNQHNKLGEILERITDAGRQQQQSLDTLHDRVQTLHNTDQVISENLSSVGLAMQGVSKSTQASTQVLETLRDNMNTRDGELVQMLQKQNKRFTLMLTAAILVAAAALGGMIVMALQVYGR